MTDDREKTIEQLKALASAMAGETAEQAVVRDGLRLLRAFLHIAGAADRERIIDLAESLARQPSDN
jgi:hypothetical protein